MTPEFLPSPWPSLVLVLHAGATLYMTGLIWFVQRVHYPLFADVGEEGFASYAAAHVARTSPVVGPPMIAEALTALLLAWRPPAGVASSLPVLGGALLVAVWVSTALLQVPRHRDLADGFEARAHRRLVATNWIRTVAWTLRAALVLWMLALALGTRAP